MRCVSFVAKRAGEAANVIEAEAVALPAPEAQTAPKPRRNRTA